MKVLSILVLTCFFSVYSNDSYSQEESIRLQMKSATLQEVIKEIEKKSNYIFVVSDDIGAEAHKRMSVDIYTEDLTEILNYVKSRINVKYKIINNQVVIYKDASNIAQYGVKKNLPDSQPPPKTSAIRGKVIDTRGEPLIGVSITVKGTLNGVASDNNGEFFMLGTPSAKNLILQFSCVGYETKEVNADYNKEMSVVMEEDVALIDEVVVTGMFKRKVEGFTGAVTKITGDEIRQISAGNILGALSRLDPAFAIHENNALGSNPSLIPDLSMRGQASMGDYTPNLNRSKLRGEIASRPNQPLFVLDGIIGVSIEKIIDLNPNQIESITLLKDAAAAAIYGSRAANGVIVVETKAPKAGVLRFSYNGDYSVEYPDLTDYNLMNAREKLQFEVLAGMYNPRWTAMNTSNLLKSYKHRQLEINRGVDTYWLSRPLQTVFQHRHSLSIEGGDPVFRYKLNFDLGQMPGVMKGTALNRNSAGMDLYYRSEKLMITNRLYVDYNANDRRSPYGSFDMYTLQNPYWRPYDANGNINEYLDVTYLLEEGSPSDKAIPSNPNPMLDTQYNQRDRNKQLSIRNSLVVEYSPMMNLRLTLVGDVQKINDTNEIFISGLHSSFKSESNIAQKGRFLLDNNDQIKVSGYLMGNYNKLINKNLFSLFLRGDIETSTQQGYSHGQRGFPNDRLGQYGMGMTTDKPSSTESMSRSVGFSGNASYTYDKRYAVDLNVRIDGSSLFGRNNRFAPFGSVGARWNLHEEGFMKKQKAISYLTLRATYGTQGSQGFTPYQSMRTFSYEGMLNYYLSSDVVGVKLRSMGNPYLKWQNTKQLNVGSDITFFENLINLRIDYYNKYTDNTVIDMTVQPSTGFATYPDNMGNISNRGYEASLRIMPYNNIAKGINASIVLTAGRNINRIERISEALKVRNARAQTPENAIAYPMPEYVEGYSQSIIWGVQSLGIDPVSGKEIFRKRDGSMTAVWDIVDRQPLGDTEPTLRGSLALMFNYGNFSFNIASRYHFGGYLYNQTPVDKIENIVVSNNADRRALTERWQKPGDVAAFKRLLIMPKDEKYGDPTPASSRFVMKDNLFELSSINMSYAMSEQEVPFLKKLNLSSIMASLYLEDVLT